jgi:hypothetical protein
MKEIIIVTTFIFGFSLNPQSLKQAGVVPLENYHLYNADNPNLEISSGMYFKSHQ